MAERERKTGKNRRIKRQRNAKETSGQPGTAADL